MAKLTEELTRFVAYITRKLRDALDSGNLRMVEEQHIRERIKPVDSGYITDQIEIEKTGWHKTDGDSFVDSIVTSDNGALIKNFVSRTIGQDSQRVTDWIREFVKTILRKTSDSEEISYERLINAFARDLLKLPQPVKIKAHLHGMTVEEDIIDPRGTVLRRFRPEDSERSAPNAVAPYLLVPRDYGYPETILERTVSVVRTLDSQNELKKLVFALRLFRVGPVDYSEYTLITDSILGIIGTIINGNYKEISPSLSYIVTRRESKDLVGFLERVAEAIPGDWLEMRGTETNELVIAYHRYEDALFQWGNLVKAIGLAMMGLESLFLERGPGLQHRLAQRLAKFMVLHGRKPTVVFNDVRNTYDTRSDFVHGEIPNVDNAALVEQRNLVLDLLRIGILTFLANRREMVTKHGMSIKRKIIAYIDHSMIGVEKAERGLHRVYKNYVNLVEGVS